MIERAESKSFLILLLLLSLIALPCSIVALTLEIIWTHIGFLMSSANYSYLCSSYQTLKLHYNITYNYNASFIGCCFSTLFQLFTVIHLVYLAVSFCKKQDKYFEELTQSLFQRLYIGYSLSLLGICIGVGYYLSYIIEEGWSCLNYTYTDWLVIGIMFISALILLLICWVYLLCFWFGNRHKFDQPQQKSVKDSPQAKQTVVIAEPYDEIKQEMKVEPQEETKTIRQSLLENQVEEDDKISSSSNQKQKLAIIPFEDYKKKEQQKENKQKMQQELIHKLLKQEQEKIINDEQQKQAKKEEQCIKKQKQNIKNQALSPDDPNFDKIFAQSQEQSQKEEVHEDQTFKEEVHEDQTFTPFFPANFVPNNEQERQQFENYKKSLLNKYSKHIKNSTSSTFYDKQYPKKHPQNIEGGRSKRLMSKYMQINKKPIRDESMYQTNKKNQSQQKTFDKYFPIIQQENQLEVSAKSINPFKIEQPQAMQPTTPVQNLLTQSTPISEQPKKIQNQKQKRCHPQQQAQQVLFFHKSKAKSPSRKKLFEQQQKFLTNQTFTSILTALVKGVEQANFKKKVKQIRQRRQRREQDSKKKVNERLLDQIRSKFT